MSSQPDPSIEEIEHAVRKARFDEADTEKFIRDRHHTKARKLAHQKHKDDRLRLAFTAGYREAAKQAERGFRLHLILIISLFAAVYFFGT